MTDPSASAITPDRFLREFRRKWHIDGQHGGEMTECMDGSCLALLSAEQSLRAAEVSSPARPQLDDDSLEELVEDFVGWWHLNREGSVNRTYAYIDNITKRLRTALEGAAPSAPPAVPPFKHLTDEITGAHQALDHAGVPLMKAVRKREGEGQHDITMGLADRIAAIRPSAPPALEPLPERQRDMASRKRQCGCEVYEVCPQCDPVTHTRLADLARLRAPREETS